MIRTPEQQYLHELIESYVAPLRSEIKKLRKELAEQQVKNLNIPAVSNNEVAVCHKCNTFGEDLCKERNAICHECPMFW